MLMEISMMRYLSIISAAMLCCLTATLSATAQESIPLSAEANRIVQEYLAKIDGRFGAVAVSTDGTKAAYHICQARLWKNCDDYELNDRFVSIPSGRLAAQKAMGRCGGNCVLLFLNEKRVDPRYDIPAIR